VQPPCNGHAIAATPGQLTCNGLGIEATAKQRSCKSRAIASFIEQLPSYGHAIAATLRSLRIHPGAATYSREALVCHAQTSTCSRMGTGPSSLSRGIAPTTCSPRVYGSPPEKVERTGVSAGGWLEYPHEIPRCSRFLHPIICHVVAPMKATRAAALGVRHTSRVVDPWCSPCAEDNSFSKWYLPCSIPCKLVSLFPHAPPQASLFSNASPLLARRLL
jgi:hypothetical protein